MATVASGDPRFCTHLLVGPWNAGEYHSRISPEQLVRLNFPMPRITVSNVSGLVPVSRFAVRRRPRERADVLRPHGYIASAN